MKSLKIAGNDLKNLFSNRFKRVAVVVITLMPLLYSFLYLYAFWDPYSKLEKMPVAIVQMDKGSTKDGENVNYGNDVVDNLKENKKVKWEFIGFEEANKGLNEKRYYSMIIIPEDFSKKITDSSEGKVGKASIKYIPNEKKNFLAAQVSSRIVLELKDEIAKSIGEEGSKVVIDSLYEVKDGIKEAYDGSEKLYDGSQKLRDGSKELSDNMKIASDGSDLLANGLTTAAEGQGQLVNGIDRIIGGLKEFGGQLSKGDERIPQLVKGAKDLSFGLDRLVLGLKEFNSQLTNSDTSQINRLIQGAGDLAVKTKEAEEGANLLNSELSKNLTAASEGIKKASQGVDVANQSLSEFVKSPAFSSLPEEDKAKIRMAAGAVKQVADSNMEANIAEPLGKSAYAAKPLAEGLGQLSAGAKLVSDGTQTAAKTIADKQTQAAAGMQQIIVGAEGAQDGARLVAGGTEALASGLSDTQKRAGEGVGELMAGASAARDGASAISSGLNTAAVKSGELSNGLGKLYDGSNMLNSGLNELTDGTKELSSGLQDGYNEINDKLKFSSEDMSKFISEPVKLEETPVNHVPDYGTGFAPYFLPLSLWVGALIMFFIVSSEVEDRFKGRASSIVIGKFITFASIGALQAVASSFILRTALHLDVKNVIAFYLFNILMSWVFIAIIQSMIMLFGDAGRFLSLALLMLQLTSCGGTFPMELVPNFFKVINPYLPMTYTVSALREIISGVDYTVLNRDITVLVLFMIVFLLGSILLKGVFDKASNKFEGKNELKAA